MSAGMNDIPDDEDPNDGFMDSDDDSNDEPSNMSEEEIERKNRKLDKEIHCLNKSILVLSSILKHSTRLQEILAAISESRDSDSKPPPKLIGERRYTEREILSGIDSLYEFDPETFKQLSSEYEYIATRLQTSEEEEEKESR
ncbi:MAG: hypothetical protein ISN28_13995 [Ectothiorhodospiraceae bacterium AqS1]|nr:hypothetical protein [Ectothiorhodospiraceae bacterium AqS1]